MDIVDTNGNVILPVSYANPQDILDYKNKYEVTEAKTKLNTVPLWTQDQLEEALTALRAQVASLQALKASDVKAPAYEQGKV